MKTKTPSNTFKVEGNPAPVMPEMQHYFFRFGSKSVHFDKIYEVSNYDTKPELKRRKENLSDVHELAIYMDDFDAEVLKEWQRDLRKSEDALPPKALTMKKTAKGKVLHTNHLAAVKMFVIAKPGAYFWIFHKHGLFIFKVVNDDIKNAQHLDESTSTGKGTPAKARFFEFVKALRREDAPDLLATTDTSGYRGTVLELKTVDKMQNLEIARAVVSDPIKKIKLLNPVEALKFLSPIQLETALFKYFNDNDFFVSAYRGASKLGIDLTVISEQAKAEIGPFKFRSKTLHIQVKRTTSSKAIIKENLDNSIYFVTLSDWKAELFDNPDYFIGPPLLTKMLGDPKAASTIKWVKAVLGDRYFDFNF